jgi:hypothetical protein
MTGWADNLEAIVAVGGVLAAAVSGAAATIWKVSQWSARAEVADAARDKAIAELVDKLGGVTTALATLGSAIREMRVGLKIRERDHAKTEGKLEQTQQSLVQVIATLQQASGSLNALWKTLQTLHPERVPKRASDRS